MGSAVLLVVEVGCYPLQHAGKRELVWEVGRWTLSGTEEGEGGREERDK